MWVADLSIASGLAKTTEFWSQASREMALFLKNSPATAAHFKDEHSRMFALGTVKTRSDSPPWTLPLYQHETKGLANPMS